MAAARPAVYACLTGDLVDSKREGDRRSVQLRLEAGLARVNAEHGDRLVVPLAITLGDEWQGLARTLEEAFALDFAVGLALDFVLDFKFASAFARCMLLSSFPGPGRVLAQAAARRVLARARGGKITTPSAQCAAHETDPTSEGTR